MICKRKSGTEILYHLIFLCIARIYAILPNQKSKTDRFLSVLLFLTFILCIYFNDPQCLKRTNFVIRGYNEDHPKTASGK